MWGGSEIMNFRGVMWSKRIEILTYINKMCQEFERKRGEQTDKRMVRAYQTRDVLFSIIPMDQVNGQKPAPWWNPRIHDYDLFYGTYVHGYGNYS